LSFSFRTEAEVLPFNSVLILSAGAEIWIL
jgi:hypothetical protein